MIELTKDDQALLIREYNQLKEQIYHLAVEKTAMDKKVKALINDLNEAEARTANIESLGRATTLRMVELETILNI